MDSHNFFMHIVVALQCVGTKSLASLPNVQLLLASEPSYVLLLSKIIVEYSQFLSKLSMLPTCVPTPPPPPPPKKRSHSPGN